MTAGPAAPELPCGPNADDRYCANYWALSAENKRLRMLIGELLDSTGPDDTERAEWLDRSRLSESAVYPDDDEDEPVDSEAERRNAEYERYAYGDPGIRL